MKMRFVKIAAIFAAVILILSFSGCAGGEKAMFDEEDLKNKSTQLAVSMAGGDFGIVIKEFSAETAKKLEEQSLNSAWEQAVLEIGEYKGVNFVDFSQKGNVATVNVILEYEKNGFKVTFVYNEKEEIEGLWLNYASKEQPLADTKKYKEEAIKIGTGEAGLDGRLTLPKNIERPPVVILVQGSGQSDMDETIGTQANKPFRDIAYGLAEQGIASIRYNKRYYQYPDTASENITIQDEVINDVDNAIDLAAKEGRVDSKAIYVLGHSLGGMLAPEIAYKNDRVSGIIVMAGTPRKLEDVILDQNKAAIEAMPGKTDIEKEALLETVVLEVEKIKALTKETPDTVIMGVGSDYWKSLNGIDTPEILKKIDLRMLFLQGAEDFQVDINTDFVMWKELLAGSENSEFISYPGLNHLFMKSNGMKNLSEYNIKSNVDEKVINDIADWVNGKKGV